MKTKYLTILNPLTSKYVFGVSSTGQLIFVFTFVSELLFRYFFVCLLQLILMHGISRVKHSLQWLGERGWAMCCNGSQISRLRLVLCSAPSVPQPVFTITEKAPTRTFSLLKAPTSAFTFKTLLRHYAKQALTPR